MESREELEEKLTQYKAQLNQVHDLLLVDSTNPQFIKLREDLDSVIELTANLINQVYNAQVKEAETTDEFGDAEVEKFSIKKQSTYTAKTGAITVGENVEVTGGDRLYAGTVVEVINDSEYKVKYFEFDAIVSLPPTSLIRMDVNNPPAQQLEEYEVNVDMACQCKYAADGQYYDCKITGVTKNGYNVLFTAYGDAQEVPIEYLREKPAEASGSGAWAQSSSSGGAKKEKKAHDGLIPIPEALKILPTDTEEEKNRKKKKIKAIKNKNRIVTIENEVKEVQQTWQKFVTKGTKRSLTGLSKSSQFASSDAVEGKLGVVNSGKGMTSFADRKKHKFDL